MYHRILSSGGFIISIFLSSFMFYFILLHFTTEFLDKRSFEPGSFAEDHIIFNY